MWTNNLRIVQSETRLLKGSSGFSMIELLIVVAIIVVMGAVSLPYVYSYRNLYKSEEQAFRIMDLMREASQRALNQRRTVRVEIDTTANALHIIDDNGDDPHTLVKSVPIESAAVLRVDVNPSGVPRPNPPGYNLAVFAEDETGHLEGAATVIGNDVWAINFQSDGSVLNEGGLPISATLFIFPATSATSDVASDTRQIRAITMYGGSGAVKYWKYNGTAFYAG